MTKLANALLSQVSAPGRRSAAHTLASAQSERRSATQADANVFQDALALVMGIGRDNALGAVQGVAATTLKAGNSGKVEEDTVPDAQAPSGLAGLALPGVPPALSALAPNIDGPTASAPTFGESIASAPTFGESIASAPSIDGLIASAPNIGGPTVSAPTFGGPIASAPTVDELTASTPTFGRPTVSAPNIDEPIASAPNIDGLIASAPSIGRPTVSAPSIDGLIASAPTFGGPTVSVPTLRGPTASTHVASKGFVDEIVGTPVSGSKVPAEPAAAGLLDTGQLASLPTAERHNEVAFSSLMVSHSKPESEPATMLSVAVAAFETRNSAPTQNSHAQPGAIEVRVGERGWDQAVGEKLVWMTSQKKQVAELHLNPPDLGPLKITITLDQSQASAQFVSAHASVREALELAMPRLREMLADSGITLGNTSVGGDSFREQAQPQPRANVTQPVATTPDPGTAVSGTRRLHHGHGLVDTFA